MEGTPGAGDHWRPSALLVMPLGQGQVVVSWEVRNSKKERLTVLGRGFQGNRTNKM